MLALTATYILIVRARTNAVNMNQMEENLVSESDSSTDEEQHGITLPPTSTPLGVKVCAVLSIFVVGIALGGAGHTVYTTYWDKMKPGEMSAAGAFVSRIDLNASICESPWDYVCNNYEKNNYLTNSFILDTQVPQFVHALEMFEDDGAAGAAKLFYRQCKQSAPFQNTSACETAYDSETTLAELWKAGASHSGLTVGRTASPYRRGFRSLVILRDEMVNFVEYPTVVTLENDDCDLMLLAKALASTDNDEILVYGRVSEVCARWRDLQNSAFAVDGARMHAAEHCEASVRRLQTPLDCFLAAAKYWPQTNQPYMDDVNAVNVISTLRNWFHLVKAHILEMAKPLGKKVVAKIDAVSVEVGWNSQNLGSGPGSAVIGLTTADSILNLKAWAMQKDLSETVHVFPRFQMSAYAINAYYTSAENNVYLPAGLFALVSSLKGETIGQLASIIAHEIWHSIDPASIKYDEHGAPSDMMSNPARTKYNNLVDCIKTSEETVTEDFADYQAVSTIQIMAAAEQNHHVISTTAASYDTQDIALLSFASFWCTAAGPTAVNVTAGVSRDPHSLPRFRVEHSLAGAVDAQFGCKPVVQRCILE